MSILFEYERGIYKEFFINRLSGVWEWTLTPAVKSFQDDYGRTLYIDETNSDVYNVIALSVDYEYYTSVNSIVDCYDTEKSYFYDEATSKIYLHIENYDPPHGHFVGIGVSVGFSMDAETAYFEGRQYPPLVSKIGSFKNSVDPLFFGLLKYQTLNIDFINNHGYFDDWKNRNAFNNLARVLVGTGTDYNNYTIKHTGFISDWSRDFKKFSLKIDDKRKSLTQTVGDSVLTLADYPYLAEGDVNAVKPVAYGKIFDALPVCLNSEQGISTFTYCFVDTKYNTPSSLDAVYVDGVAKTPGNVNLSAGTFTLSEAQVDGGEVTCDFTMPTTNGVDIIKDLMYRYDNKTYNSSIWDTAETDAAKALSRNTSLYCDGDTKLNVAIEKVCFDCDITFYLRNSGLYNCRVYDADRVPVATIPSYKYLDEPDFDNTSSEYLTDVKIKWKPRQNSGTHNTYVNDSYHNETMARYKRENIGSYETGLYTEEDARLKSETVMQYSSNVNDIIANSLPIEYDYLEIRDFIITSPDKRIGQDAEMRTYEVLYVERDYIKNTVKLKLREI